MTNNITERVNIMKAIWKFPIHVSDSVVVQMPKGARILPHVEAVSPSVIVFWAEVNSVEGYPTEDRVLYVVGTGNQMPERANKHLGTTVAGQFVWHLYEHEETIAEKNAKAFEEEIARGWSL